MYQNVYEDFVTMEAIATGLFVTLAPAFARINSSRGIETPLEPIVKLF